MFNRLKEKLKNWTKKVVESKEKPAKQKKEKLAKEIKVPIKFNIGMEQFQPDLEQIKEISEKKGEKEIPLGVFKRIKFKVSKVKISEKEFEVYAEELEMLLLENNVALEVTDKMIKELKEEIIGKEFLKKEIEQEIKDIFKNIIRKILIEPFNIIEKIKEKSLDQSKEPYIILFCGINGTGKTTTIAKIAEHLKKKNLSCVLAAADTFRAASIEQIKKHGEKLNIKVIAQDYGSDPAAVSFDAINYAKKNLINCVLIDTAGRMHTAKNLLKEIEKISKVSKPDLKIFVGESLTGNDIIEQVKSFDWAIGIDGIILTKADIDEKGGTALSVGEITKKPILYLGTGQEYNAIEPFDKEKFIKRLGL
ncbi:MAG: signal recognition particle-docking protein FtsY [Nanoarchaeota archaeon]|nr:signal recognition particle-docking protein FtsY [Nanoarchaeota archaeon]